MIGARSTASMKRAGFVNTGSLDPETQRADFFRPGHERALPARTAGRRRPLPKRLLPGFWINVGWLWQELAADVAARPARVGRNNTMNQAETLIQALPYIKEYAGKTIVIKYGGNAMMDDDLKAAVMQDVTLMRYVGVNPILVHGGGPEISEAMQRMGKTPQFVGGLRVTDEETMEIVEMVLTGKTNKSIVAHLNAQGGQAVGLSGKDGNLIQADQGDHQGRSGLRRAHRRDQPRHHPHPDGGGLHPRHLQRRHRAERRKLQRQRRHRCRRAGGRPGGDQAHHDDRRGGHLPGLRRQGQPDPRDDRPGCPPAHHGRRGGQGHDPQGGRLHHRRRQRRQPRPHPGWPPAPRPAHRDSSPTRG